MNYLMKRHMMMKNKEREYNKGYEDYRGSEYRDYRGHDYNERSGMYERPYMKDYRGDYREREEYRDYRSQDYTMGRDYHSEEQLMEMYHRDLDKWCNKLKEYDRFKLPKEEVYKKAKNMGVAFMDYTEEEFYVIYLLMIKLFKSVANEPHTYLAMAKSILEEPESKISPSEKVQVMLYEIAMGGKSSF